MERDLLKESRKPVYYENTKLKKKYTKKNSGFKMKIEVQMLEKY